MKNKKLFIIAGPCSIDNINFQELYYLSKLNFVWGVRVVGLKSRTSFNPEKEFLGIDFKDYEKSIDIFYKKNKLVKKFPSIDLMEKIIKDTNLNVATEIMDPWIQLELMSKFLPKEKVLIWNPATSQLGWTIKIMAKFAKEKKWYLGLKNPKWYGDEKAENNSMEKAWEGAFSFANYYLSKKKIILIHRGVEHYQKDAYRNFPVHKNVEKIKQKIKAKIFFDPSHIHGPKLKHKIIKETIKAMKMKINNNEYLYDGILIEVGTSKTDTNQHISLKETEILIKELSSFRELVNSKEKIE
ncbi:MAG: hypothetical protein N2593_00055 [Patescibacteria group bacterium]|nr:hypothetical protein [Patescibacteria group bacterium]